MWSFTGEASQEMQTWLHLPPPALWGIIRQGKKKLAIGQWVIICLLTSGQGDQLPCRLALTGEKISVQIAG